MENKNKTKEQTGNWNINKVEVGYAVNGFRKRLARLPSQTSGQTSLR